MKREVGISINNPIDAHQNTKSNSEKEFEKNCKNITKIKMYKELKIIRIFGNLKRLLFINLENCGLVSVSTCSVPLIIERGIVLNDWIATLNDKITTIGHTFSYNGFKAKRAGFEKTIEIPTRRIAKYEI